ncbi:MAG: hypothetical protein ACRDRK_16230 [Pseudonocardia sp.]
MGNVGFLILFSFLAMAVFAKARVATGAVLFGVIGVVLFITTPMGAGLPGMVADFVSTVSEASQPLTGESEAVG